MLRFNFNGVFLVSEEILSEERAQIMVENYKLGGLMRYLVLLATEKDVSLIEFILFTWHFCFSALSIHYSYNLALATPRPLRQHAVP